MFRRSAVTTVIPFPESVKTMTIFKLFEEICSLLLLIFCFNIVIFCFIIVTYCFIIVNLSYYESNIFLDCKFITIIKYCINYPQSGNLNFYRLSKQTFFSITISLTYHKMTVYTKYSIISFFLILTAIKDFLTPLC